MRVNRYTNSGHRDEGGCCDLGIPFGSCIGNCDNYFLLCLRPPGFSYEDKTCPSGHFRSGLVGGDDLTFSDSVGVLSNPVVFRQSGQWRVSAYTVQAIATFHQFHSCNCKL